MKRMTDLVSDMLKYQDSAATQGASYDNRGRQIAYDGGHTAAQMQ